MSKKLGKYTPTKNYPPKISLDKLNQMSMILFKKGRHILTAEILKKHYTTII